MPTLASICFVVEKMRACEREKKPDETQQPNNKCQSYQPCNEGEVKDNLQDENVYLSSYINHWLRGKYNINHQKYAFRWSDYGQKAKY